MCICISMLLEVYVWGEFPGVGLLGWWRNAFCSGCSLGIAKFPLGTVSVCIPSNTEWGYLFPPSSILFLYLKWNIKKKKKDWIWNLGVLDLSQTLDFYHLYEFRKSSYANLSFLYLKSWDGVCKTQARVQSIKQSFQSWEMDRCCSLILWFYLLYINLD